MSKNCQRIQKYLKNHQIQTENAALPEEIAEHLSTCPTCRHWAELHAGSEFQHKKNLFNTATPGKIHREEPNPEIQALVRASRQFKKWLTIGLAVLILAFVIGTIITELRVLRIGELLNFPQNPKQLFRNGAGTESEPGVIREKEIFASKSGIFQSDTSFFANPDRSFLNFPTEKKSSGDDRSAEFIQRLYQAQSAKYIAEKILLWQDFLQTEVDTTYRPLAIYHLAKSLAAAADSSNELLQLANAVACFANNKKVLRLLMGQKAFERAWQSLQNRLYAARIKQ